MTTTKLAWYNWMLGIMMAVLYLQLCLGMTWRLEFPEYKLPEVFTPKVIHTPPGPYEYDCYRWCWDQYDI